ncbi:FecR domain-containing protein [Mucilaginibacter sp. KACC 22773]|uniref:FecR family protein n=1 Tax=Mucilaginibacter sp. KACC 22773 TaxID=3025671 RepID=UPI0023656C61|nr:FecR family protein [Mucilaginibacter sp. KACC 22773]WDF76868.1 FecR domain-containing protein [Mucilaginibacter sp. KACC 22773]
MENNAYDIKELAHKLENGTITPEEMAWFEQWYQRFNDEEVLLTGSRHSGTNELKDSIFNRIASQMEAPAQPKRKVISLWRNVAAAAAIVLLVAFAAFYKNAILDIVDPVKQVDLTSKAGEHRQISLPDGTLVWLSPSTRISYPDNFRGAQRLVKLDGEAFFDVKHDANHPFIIQSGAIKTVVLGTSFNVTAYKDAKTAEVTVVSGKVGVLTSASGKNQRQIMTARQRAVFNKTDGLLVKENYPDAAKFLGQRNGNYDFEGASMQTVADELGRQYGVQINVDPRIANSLYYGHLNTTRLIGTELDLLCTVMDNTRWQKVGNQYYIREIIAKH